MNIPVTKVGCDFFVVCRCLDSNNKVIGYGVSPRSYITEHTSCKSLETLISQINSGLNYCVTDPAGNNPVTVTPIHFEQEEVLRGQPDGLVENNLINLPTCDDSVCTSCVTSH